MNARQHLLDAIHGVEAMPTDDALWLADIMAVEREAAVDVLLECAGVSDVSELCKDCGGRGRKTYASTATWHGGMGGATITQDVCDKCWGSGNAARPWPSWRDEER